MSCHPYNKAHMGRAKCIGGRILGGITGWYHLHIFLSNELVVCDVSLFTRPNIGHRSAAKQPQNLLTSVCVWLCLLWPFDCPCPDIACWLSDDWNLVHLLGKSPLPCMVCLWSVVCIWCVCIDSVLFHLKGSHPLQHVATTDIPLFSEWQFVFYLHQEQSFWPNWFI